MQAVLEVFRVLRRDVVADLLNGRITVEDFYRRMYVTAVLITVAIFALSLTADVGGINGLNIILIPVWVVIVGYIGFYPTYITMALAAGGAASLGRDADRQRIIDGMVVIGEKWKQFFLHGAMFGGVFFLTRFLVPIREYPFAGMVMLGALITLGLWSWLYESGTAYKKYVLALVLVSLTIGVFSAFTGKPEKDGHPAAGIISFFAGVVNTLKKAAGYEYGEWVTVAHATTCSPTWNESWGWCTVISDAAKGTYRVIPRYKSWQLWQNDGSFIAVPPYGLDLYAHWKGQDEFIDEFHRLGHTQGSNNYGALVVRNDDTEVIEALKSPGSPREFEVEKDGTEIAVNVNLTPLLNFYQYNQGEIPVEVQRLN